MADDTSLLSELGMKPSDCTSVDCYWSLGEDVVHLRVEARRASRTDPGFYAYRAGEDLKMVHLLAVVDDEQVSSSTIESAMVAFSQVGKHVVDGRGVPLDRYRRIVK